MDLEKYRAQRNQNNPFANLLGIITEEIRPGYAVSTMPLDPSKLNMHGIAHGGALFSLADSTGGAASESEGIKTVTVDATFYFMRAAVNTSYLKAEARQVKSGRTLSIFEIIVTNDKKEQIARGMFTYMKLGEPVSCIA